MHTICHVEFSATDLARSQAFYEGLFGWTFRSFGDDMVVFGQGEKHIGGLIRSEARTPGNSPTVWFEVEDVDAMVTKALTVGGAAAKPKAEVPHVGWSATVSDPDGNTVGLVQFA